MAANTAFDVCRLRALSELRRSKEWLTNPDPPASREAMNITSQLVAVGVGQKEVDTYYRETYLMALIHGRWAMSGFPTVTMGHRTAAVLMATSIKPDDAQTFVRCPWPAFVIRIPNDLLYIDREGQSQEVALVAVTCITDLLPELPGERWYYQILTSGVQQAPDGGYYQGISLWGFNTEMQYMALKHPGLECEQYDHWSTVDQTESDDRCDTLARALIIGTCLHLAGDPRQRPQGAESKVTQRRSKQREGDELPSYDEFELHSAVKINLHHAMRDYVRHGGSSPKVQTLVAGHWKQVVFGTGRSQRRMQHVLPYWRGDIDAPISTRTGK